MPADVPLGARRAGLSAGGTIYPWIEVDMDTTRRHALPGFLHRLMLVSALRRYLQAGRLPCCRARDCNCNATCMCWFRPLMRVLPEGCVDRNSGG